jgi:hypothetical protein
MQEDACFDRRYYSRLSELGRSRVLRPMISENLSNRVNPTSRVNMSSHNHKSDY